MSHSADAWEQEADAIAGKVVAGEQVKLVGSRVAATSQSEREGSMHVSDNFLIELGRTKGGGQRIADDVRTSVEHQMGQGFDDVRIHTDAKADELSKSINAKAFSSEKNIFFRQGEYRPNMGAGMQLLAHEFVHTAQQVPGFILRKDDKPSPAIPEGQRKKIRVYRNYQDISHLIKSCFDPGTQFKTPPRSAPEALKMQFSNTIPVAFHAGFKKLVDYFLFGDLSANGRQYAMSFGFDMRLIDYSLLTATLEERTALKAKYGSSDWGYRLTFWKTSPADVGTVLVEDLGMIKTYQETETSEASKTKFATSGFKFDESETSPWRKRDKQEVYAATDTLPKTMLSALTTTDNLTFRRDINAKAAGDSEAGHYASSDNSITIKNWAYSSQSYLSGKDLTKDMKQRKVENGVTKQEKFTPDESDTIYGNSAQGYSSPLRSTIYHEIAHAVDLANLRSIQSEYFALQKSRGQLVSSTASKLEAYKKQNDPTGVIVLEIKRNSANTITSLGYKLNGATAQMVADMKAIYVSFETQYDVYDKKIEAKGKTYNKTVSESGGSKGVIANNVLEMADSNEETPFSMALARDGNEPLTDYAGTNRRDNFADSFALFHTDPKQMQQLRPALYQYFATTKLPSPRVDE